MIHHHRTPQNTARIDRTACNVAFCTGFSRATLREAIDRYGMDTDRHDKYRPQIDRL
jgi:hypothetical protein